MKFLNALAYVFAVGSVIKILLCLLFARLYEESHDQLLDELQGVRRRWPISRTVLVFIVCLLWLMYGGDR